MTFCLSLFVVVVALIFSSGTNLRLCRRPRGYYTETKQMKTLHVDLVYVAVFRYKAEMN